MANPDDFTGTPFVAGSIRGERCWNMYSGQLFSAARKSVWHAGENVSQCTNGGSKLYVSAVSRLERGAYQGKYITAIEYHDEAGRTAREVYRKSDGGLVSMATYFSANEPVSVIVFWKTATKVTRAFPLPEWSPDTLDMRTVPGKETTYVVMDQKERYDKYSLQEFNELAEMNSHFFEDCQCGFYAYTNIHSNEYATKTSMIGVIEGYGETLIGTKGFRSEKARILALAPTGFYRPGTDDITKALGVDDAVLSTDGRWVFISGRRNGKVMVYRNAAERIEKTQIKRMNFDALRVNYPNVEVFDSVSEMREAFPLDAS